MTPTFFDLPTPLSKPIFHIDPFSFKNQTGIYLTPAGITCYTKIGSCKFQADIQSEYHREKILECLALSRFFPHISKSPSFSSLHSAYRKFHSTETALLKLSNDIMETIDFGKITILRTSVNDCIQNLEGMKTADGPHLTTFHKALIFETVLFISRGKN